MKVRQPAVAGQFYSAQRDELLDEIERCFTHPLGPGKRPPSPSVQEKIVALLSPHAGYMYSGPVAAHGYYSCSSLRDVGLVIVVGPNHWAIGSGVATYREGRWATPLGEVEIDSEAAKRIVQLSGIVDFDELAHSREHSIEVQLPFLQWIYGSGFKFLPICMALQDEETAREVGEAVTKLVKDWRERVLIVASSDFSHYVSHDLASRRDGELLKEIVQLDVEGHYKMLRQLDVSACGYGPIAAVMVAAKGLGASKGSLLKYATSGDTSGNYGSVVGYASVLFA